MKYLTQFSEKLCLFRQQNNLSIEEVARLCNVNDDIVESWERPDNKTFPSLENLLDLCFKANARLEHLIDCDAGALDQQLELPGLRFIEEGDISQSVDVLLQEVEKVIPDKDEVELLKRFRRSDAESRKLIIQLMG
ncbi:MAG: helix-turn-helix domain-containing protein [Pseudomonadales bacterium]|uniref:HTH cro/C1-type domain-containing protein n=1 Tax=Oleiphilus messinensis TaxID=141451 RepID=A0A1Y0I9Z7_9GAMM|nr:helix-turn-helix transcriptional regulator [Oleiphilus messinensis]ARU56989.1 hypothetical protein OLMES_2945 [Oleiphilus messinensis]MCG8611141.1 helix-turn-helix domain-containing protein [Pseudomonadales bacterium]